MDMLIFTLLKHFSDVGHSILLAEVSDGHKACRDNVELVKYTNTSFCIGQWAAHIHFYS